MKRIKTMIAGLALVCASPLATAAPGDWYVGGGAGWSSYNGNVVDLNPTLANETYTVTRFDDTGTGWKLFTGYQFHQHFAVELAYTDLGKFSFDASVSGGPAGAGATEYSEVKPTCWSLSLVGLLPVSQNFTLLGKAGVCRWDDRFRGWEVAAGGGGGAIPYPETPESTGTDLTYGLGLRYDFTRNLGLRLEWERFENVTHDRASADLWSVNLQYTF